LVQSFRFLNILIQFINFQTCNHGQPKDGKKSSMILQGVARQIIEKCGFRLWTVEIPKSVPLPAVFVGIDVFHAPFVYDPITKTRGRKKSVAAIIVEVFRKSGLNTSHESYSKSFCREGGKEYNMRNDLESTVREALFELNVTPGSVKSVFVWRDGMPETAYKHAAEEIDGIRKGIQAATVGTVAPSGSPAPIAYIVCQKRINTKLFTSDGQSGAPSGTLVTSLQGTDGNETFYLNGRAPPFSTPKPVRFICMQRDADLINVSLPDLTWNQCHAYPNWTGSIKVPSVCQKAHKLAELAGMFTDGGDNINHKKFKNRPYFL
jgi:aubergine